MMKTFLPLDWAENKISEGHEKLLVFFSAKLFHWKWALLHYGSRLFICGLEFAWNLANNSPEMG